MARFKIKESEIRQYVRSLIREAIENEGRKADPTNERELEKMRRGEDFNFGILGATAKQKVRDYFRDNGIPFPKKPKGGNAITIINGATGEDKTPENTENAISDKHEKQRLLNNQKRLSNYHAKRNKGDIDKMQQMVNEPLSDNEVDDENISIGTTDSQTKANDALGDDAYTQKWLSMSDEEKEAMRDKIRRNRQKESSAQNDKIRGALQKSVSSGYPSPQELKQQIKGLKDKQAMLGQHNDINDKKWREYDFLIKDREKILNKYYGGYQPSSDDEYADEVVNNALADDLSGEEEFQGGNYGIEITKNNPQEDEYEPLDDDDFDNRSKKRRDFQDLKDMGFYDDDDDW